MELLEREFALAQLEAALQQVTAGNGRTVLVAGDAGIGKTALVQHFTVRHGQSARVLWGACDALFTPRPLGPLLDIAHEVGGDLLAKLEADASRAAIFLTFLDDLRAGTRPTVAVMEDVHWADAASLDLVKYLGRRIDRTRALLILTYRDDELVVDHPLRLVLGDLPSAITTRLSLTPLSAAGVETLARQAKRPAAGLHAATGGNPFFVSEVLASASAGVPATVRDAVLVRAGRLSPLARGVVELVSVVPAKTERWLLDAVLSPAPSTLDECTDAGMVRVEPDAVLFRHELARQAVESALPAARRQHLHAAVLRAIEARGADAMEAARLAHHASGAADGHAILRYAPAAARDASRLRAHREAALHYSTALQYAQRLAARERAELLGALAYEAYLSVSVEGALNARIEALNLWRQVGDREKEGHTLRWLSRLQWLVGRHADAQRHAVSAIEILEGLPSGRDLAMAYSNRAQLHALAFQPEEAVRWGLNAIELARSLGDHETVVHALNNVGLAESFLDEERGHAALEQSLRLAVANGFEEHAARAYNNLGSILTMRRDYPRATIYLNEGLQYCAEHDMDLWRMHMCARHANLRLQRGEWDSALQEAEAVRAVGVSRHTSIVARLTAATVRVRRGEPTASEALDQVLPLLQGATDLQDVGPAAALWAEAAWLKDDPATCIAKAKPGFDLALTRPDRWTLGELAFWMWRGGALRDPPERAARPFALQISGDWRAAAEEWERIGCPYERAWALADGGEAAQRVALGIFEGLGARPAADIVRQRLRTQGARDIPRAARAGAKRHPRGLSNREVEVLKLLPEMQLLQIARKLYLSPKTVEHHVTSIYSKLEVHSRAEAVAAAYRLGLVSPPRP